MKKIIIPKETLARLRELFDQSGSLVINSHFVYKAMTHGKQYVDKDDLLSQPEAHAAICKAFAIAIIESGMEFDVIVGPAHGAIALASGVSIYLKEHGHTSHRWVYVVEDPDDRDNRKVFKGQFAKHVKGKKILLIEDIINNGISVSQTIDAIKRSDGELVAVLAIVNRNAEDVDASTFDLEDEQLYTILAFQMDNYPADECPMCKKDGKGSVRTDLGKGRIFLAQEGLT